MARASALQQLIAILRNRFWPVVIAFAVLNAGGWYVAKLWLKDYVRGVLHELDGAVTDARANANSAARDAAMATLAVNQVNSSIIEAESKARKCLADLQERQREADKLAQLKNDIAHAQSAIAEYQKIGNQVELWRKELLASSIHIGMAVPYFGGGGLPDGFVEIRSGGMWPDGEVMPERLRGKKMELGDHGWLIGYATSPSEIGALYNDGKVAVEGSAFTIAETEADRDTVPPGLPWNGIRGVGAGDFDKRLVIEHQNGGQPIKAGEHFDNVPAHKYKDKSASATAGGVCTVALNKRESLPLHVMCRWILRVK